MMKVLHVTPDDKFFDGVYSKWEEESIFQNSAIFIAPSENYQFKYIKSIDNIKILFTKKQIKECFLEEAYDIIFFHSLPATVWKYFKYIPKNKIVIWWGWGYDVYGRFHGLRPLIPLELYKGKTKIYNIKSKFSFVGIVKCFINFLLWPYYKRLRDNVINRIDYFQPVTKDEFFLMQKNKVFRAKEFYYKGAMIFEEKEIHPLPINGNILLGNSATSTNNHLDILNIVSKYRGENQHIIMPLNYGDNNYLSWLKRNLSKYNVTPLYNFLARDEYFSLVGKCSYCCIGTIRQQAMGNILFALRNGIKVFLYRDSVAYNSLKSLGYTIYAIEDIDEDSFKTPLTKDEILQNLEANKNEIRRRELYYLEFMEEHRYLK